MTIYGTGYCEYCGNMIGRLGHQCIASQYHQGQQPFCKQCGQQYSTHQGHNCGQRLGMVQQPLQPNSINYLYMDKIMSELQAMSTKVDKITDNLKLIHNKLIQETPNPVWKGSDDKWYFWDETWSESYGPYDTREEADNACNKYAEEL